MLLGRVQCHGKGTTAAPSAQLQTASHATQQAKSKTQGTAWSRLPERASFFRSPYNQAATASRADSDPMLQGRAGGDGRECCSTPAR